MKSENDTFVLIVILIVTAEKSTNEGTLRGLNILLQRTHL